MGPVAANPAAVCELLISASTTGQNTTAAVGRWLLMTRTAKFGGYAVDCASDIGWSVDVVPGFATLIAHQISGS
jgi:hypothetical protein